MQCAVCGRVYANNLETCPFCEKNRRPISAGQQQQRTNATYLGGHPRLTKKTSGGILVNEEGLFFYKGPSTLLTFPYNEVEAVRIETQQQLQQRITATRILLLGVFALAVPKKGKGQGYLVIDSHLDNQIYAVVFECPRAGDVANIATAYLHPHLEARSRQFADDAKACPYCAELIKVEAIKCRFCGSDLVAQGQSSQQ